MVLNNLTNYVRRHFKLFTNCHVSWDTLYSPTVMFHGTPCICAINVMLLIFVFMRKIMTFILYSSTILCKKKFISNECANLDSYWYEISGKNLISWKNAKLLCKRIIPYTNGLLADYLFRNPMGTLGVTYTKKSSFFFFKIIYFIKVV